ncbi:HSP70 and/or MreB Mbl domain containing protein [Asbolus verrucosus]|uniref:HSP70 and/or MreB Mbl domain containing protein n=1 Tax=Asbolus verrucosus TaxID=1661398 RepID=A0A482W2T6_ASBVE|nr:HSP70 and/or MreB Mbl domain containing protein [Asbolus verrucosus]
MSLAIGIDLGTTNCCVAIHKDGKTEIIENENGKRTTPSFVFYSENGILVGHEAILRSVRIPENGIFDVKRLIGRKYDDPAVQKNKLMWPFEIIREHRNEPLIQLTQNGEILELRPEEVCAEILKKLKNDANRRTGMKIKNVVITVPAYFTNHQKQATEHAAKIAGFNVLKLISEPTAAALAFAQDARDLKNRTVLVYDLGGGTFDVSLLKFNSDEGSVIGVGGNSNLGGRDFDNNLLNYCLKKIREQYQFSLVEQQSDNRRKSAIRRLKYSCEKVKKELTDLKRTSLDIDEFFGTSIKIDITRELFESLNEHLFQKTIEIVDDVLKDAKISKQKIDDVILIGGSTRIPRIETIVMDYFNRKTLNKTVNPDEAVAIGAALQASYLSNSPLQCSHMYTLRDVTPFSIGLEVADHTMSVIIKKNERIPTMGEKKYKTSYNKQREVNLRLFEGENKYVKDNIALGELKISGITPKKAGEVEINVCVHVDLNGIVNITATETSQNTTKKLVIDLKSRRLTHEEISKIRANKTLYK